MNDQKTMDCEFLMFWYVISIYAIWYMVYLIVGLKNVSVRTVYC